MGTAAPAHADRNGRSLRFEGNNPPMCWLITIAVADDAVDAIRAAHAGSGMSMVPTRSPSALAAAGDGMTPLLVTAGGCSCAWYRRPDRNGAQEQIARARQKYEALRWSPAKIARALASMTSRPRPDDGLHAAVIELLAALVPRHGKARVWVHDFRGRAETETYQIVRRESWPVADLASRAAGLEPDVLVEVVASAGR